MLVTVSEQGADIGGRLHISFMKWLGSTAFILSIVKRIQPEFRYDIKTDLCVLYRYKISRWYHWYDSKLIWNSNYFMQEKEFKNVEWWPFCSSIHVLTHWGRVMHVCISKLTIIGSIMAWGLAGTRRFSQKWQLLISIYEILGCAKCCFWLNSPWKWKN